MFEADSSENTNYNDFSKSMDGCVTVDLSRCGITCIPDEVLGKFPNIQYLYLEGNELTELSQAFFPSLRELRWLDLRNNKLKLIPNSIMDHPSLQVLLLEGNNLENIPVEVGSVESLRGLQLARNPISFPPPNIVNRGVQCTIEFMRKQWQQIQMPQQIHLISETQSRNGKHKMGVCKSAQALKTTSKKAGNLRKTLSSLSAANLSKCINVQPICRQRQQPATIRTHTSHQDSFAVTGPVNNEKKSKGLTKKNNSNVPQQHDQLKRNITRDMQSNLLRDIWIEKVRQMLLQQEAILQRRKNSEALKQWQDETKMLQQSRPSKGVSIAATDFPYDTDPEFRKMLSRRDLKEDWRKPRDSSLHQIRHEEPLNSKIASIMVALQELQASQSGSSVSPRSEQMVLANEIKKIRDIQRSLNALKLTNFGQLGHSS